MKPRMVANDSKHDDNMENYLLEDVHSVAAKDSHNPKP